MLALFLTLIERITQLVKLRQSDREQLFREVVEPLFTSNCSRWSMTICQCSSAPAKQLRKAEQDQSSLADAVTEIRTSREQMLLTRRKVREMA